MSVHVIKVPDVGEGIAEVELVAWSVAAGDTVARNQVLAEVMTDKANVEIPSPLAGVVAEIHGEVGARLAVGTSLIELEVADDGPAPAPAAAPRPASAGSPPDDRHGRPDAGRPGAHPAASPPAWPPVQDRPGGERPRATPAVRHRARQAGVDLRSVSGTGPGGRITDDDLAAWAGPAGTEPARAPANGAASSPPAPSPSPATVEPVAPTGTSTAAVSATAGDESDRGSELSERRIVGIRRVIAERMVASTQSIPHITYVEEVDVTALEELRSTLNESKADEQPRLTLLPFLIRALVDHLATHQELNAHVDDERGVLKLFTPVHVGIATQTSNGLLVPVVRDTQRQSIWSLAAGIASATESARDGTATPADLTGSTITITSLGAMGGLVTTPVINKPEVAIVGVNKIAVRPVWSDGRFVPRQIMNLSSSFDHRIVDGWQAATFVQGVKASLEQPALLFVERA